VAKLKPLTYRAFCEVIYLLEGCFGPEVEGQRMIYASRGSGYMPSPSGFRCSFKCRELDEMVTVLEIDAVLNHLKYNAEVWQQVSGSLQLEPMPTAIDKVPDPVINPTSGDKSGEGHASSDRDS